MALNRSIEKDHKPLSNPDRQGNGAASGDISPLSGSRSFSSVEPEHLAGLTNSTKVTLAQAEPEVEPSTFTFVNESESSHVNREHEKAVESTKSVKQEKRERRDFELLNSDRWLVRNGHFMTFVALYLFSVMVLFRPYEIVPGLGFLSATAFYFAMVTLACYFPSQLAVEGNLTMMSTEVKALLGLTAISLVTIPIAKDPGVAWETFNDSYSKSVIIFIVLVNVVRTRKRLMSMMWLSFGIGIYLSYCALDLYMKGQFDVEDYRVAVDIGGMFGNPNEMAMHFVMMTPLLIVLGIAAESKLAKLLYFGSTFLLIAANMVTFSRGGFLGLMAVGFVLAWKIGRRQRLNVSIASIVIGGIVILAAPGNYGLRMLSIFIPGLDPVGSSDQRKELLERSLLVTARNPWGIGIGNFPIVGVRNLQTHNAFTQVSAELGILGLIAYLIFMLSPFRKLSAIERKHFNEDRADWYYYMAIGLQASIIGYMVSSFFASVAYNWFIYYLIAYAVAFRRIYSVENDEIKDPPEDPKTVTPEPAYS